MMTRTPEILAVTFDLDGLMCNTETLYEEVGAELLRRRGKAITKQLLDQMMGRPSRIALQIMIDWYDLDTTIDQLEEETDQVFDGLLEERLAPMPGLLDLMGALETAEIPRAIATSSRPSYADRVLELMDMKSRFQFVLTSEDVRQGKPEPEIYQKAARQFQIRPPQMMVLEDSEIGCRAAVAAGALTVAVPGEHSRQHDFTGVAFIAETLADPRIYALLKLR